MTVTVLGVEFVVKVVKDIAHHGELIADKRIILISEASPMKDATLLHEILHAAMFVSGWNEKLGDDEEGLVRMLEHAIAPIYGKRWRSIVDD